MKLALALLALVAGARTQDSDGESNIQGELFDPDEETTTIDKIMTLAGVLADHPVHKELGARAISMYMENDELDHVTTQEVLAMASTVMSPGAAAQANAEVTVNDAGGNDLEEAVTDTKESHVYQGDMNFVNQSHMEHVMALAASGGSVGAGKPWANNKLNYCFDSDVADSVKKVVALAVAQFKKAVPGISMVNVGFKSTTGGGNGAGLCQVSPAVYITSQKTGCWSYVGELTHWKSQGFNLQAPGCDSVGTAMHEFLHAFGQAHEQARPDRDKYVSINFANIKQGKEHNFKVDNLGDMNRPYDMLSLMHYGEKDFGSGKVTISVKPPAYDLYTKDANEYHKYKLGNRLGMTQMDADQLADQYKTQASKLGSVGPCTDKKKDGAPWKDRYNQGCDIYRKYFPKSCKRYTAGNYCCSTKTADCGGGIQLQEWVPPAAGSSVTVNPSPAPFPPPSPPPKLPPNPPAAVAPSPGAHLTDKTRSPVCNWWKTQGYCKSTSIHYNYVSSRCERTCAGIPTDVYSNCGKLAQRGMCGASFVSGATVKEKCPDSCKSKANVKASSSANALLPNDLAQGPTEADLTPEDLQEAENPPEVPPASHTT